jgi:hypothetical protein
MGSCCAMTGATRVTRKPKNRVHCVNVFFMLASSTVHLILNVYPEVLVKESICRVEPLQDHRIALVVHHI